MLSQHQSPAIEIAGLVKRYGDTTAVDGIDLDVPTGAVLGLLGPNGAGKSTVVRILATLLRPDEGSVRIGGYDVVRDAYRVRQLIGLTGQYASIDEDLTGMQNLTLIGRLLGMSKRQARHRASDLIEDARLHEAAARPVKTYSGGMRRRLDLAASLVSQPAVVFLDEPTTGLDPARRGDIWSVIQRLAERGSTVLLTTQYLEEADHLADDVVVLDAGRIVARGTPDDLKRRLGRQTLEIKVTDPARLGETARMVTTVIGSPSITDEQTGQLSAPVPDGRIMPTVVRQLDEAGIEVSELALRLPSLDDVFLTLTGHHATSDANENTTGTSSEGSNP